MITTDTTSGHRRLQAWALGGIAQVEILNRKHDVILISSY